MFPEESLAFPEQEHVHSAQHCGTEPVGCNVTQCRRQQPNAAAENPRHCNLVNEIRIDEHIRSGQPYQQTNAEESIHRKQ
jgi:hypothetical protein